MVGAKTTSLVLRAQTVLMPARGPDPIHFTWVVLHGVEGDVGGKPIVGALGTPPMGEALTRLVGLAPAEHGVWVLTHASCAPFLGRLRELGATCLVEPPAGSARGWPHPAWFVFDMASTGEDMPSALEACLVAAQAEVGGGTHFIFEAFALPPHADPHLANRLAALATMCDERDRLPPPAHYRLSAEPHRLSGCQLLLAGDRCDDVAAVFEALAADGLAIEASAPVR